MHLSFIIHSQREGVAGWRFLWAKRVRGFDPTKHCARCLVGEYETRFGLSAPVNALVDLKPAKAGEIIYFCGVSAPYRWANNLHLAVKVTGDVNHCASALAYTGDELTIAGAVAIPFTDEIARSAYPALGREFLTCRNFQFGAAMRACEAL